MFAVIKTGGKQYKVKAGDRIDVEKLEGNVGDTISLGNVMMTGTDGSIKSGTPFLDKATLDAEIVEQYRNDKVIIFKKKRRHNYRRKKGHRQYLTAIKITAINA